MALQPLAGTLPAGQKLGRYEVLAKLASGGMAVVYVGRAQGVAGFERLVALKVLHSNFAHEEEFIRMFLDEARLAARIRHPNVVPTIDISDSADRGYFLVMEYIEGDHLGALLSAAHKAGERLPRAVVLRIISDVVLGLGAAHDLRDEAGKLLHIVHRDVSPHNVMVGRDGIARLTDFGVAKAEDRLAHTRDGQVKGKLAYMAPEQASSGTSDARSDLFSVGIILWECLTGRRLFRADSTAATLNKLLHEEIARPSSIDPALEPLDGVVMRTLERDPEMRFQTADELVEALELAARDAGGVASLRAVSKAVRHYAAPKIKRDKTLIEEAKRALSEDRGDDGFEIDGLSEPTMLSASEVSLSMPSMSKISGVYSSPTSAGFVPMAPPKPPPLVVPPPAGAGHEVDEFPPFARRGLLAGRGTGVRLTLLLLVLVVALGLWLRRSDEENVAVESLAPLTPPRPTEPAAPLTPPQPAEPVAPSVMLPATPAPAMTPPARAGAKAQPKDALAPAAAAKAAPSSPPRASERERSSASRSSRTHSARRRAVRGSQSPSPPPPPSAPRERERAVPAPEVIDAPLANPYTN